MTTPSGRHELDDRGSVTAEIAVALPAVVMVLAACLGGMSVASTQLRAQDAAADAARVLGRGEPVSTAEQIVARSVPEASLLISRPQSLVCATVVVEPRLLLVPLRVEGASCAFDDAP